MAGTQRWDIAGHEIKVSKVDKVLYPDDGYTKGDVLDYYRSVAATMLPHLRGRPLTLRRFPDGIGAGGFFQKAASDYFPDWMHVEAIPQRGAPEPLHQVICDDEATLLYLANQAALEYHVGLSTIDDLERPVLVVLDLDPPQRMAIAELRSVVRSMCERFRDAGLAPHVQATGGAGFHVVAPLSARSDFDTVRSRAREIAEDAVRDAPDRLTVEQRKENRGDRVFLDTNRNAYGQTVIAPYSLRARPGAPAATPLDCSELARATPRDYGLANMKRRLDRKTDPWAKLSADAVTVGRR